MRTRTRLPSISNKMLTREGLDEGRVVRVLLGTAILLSVLPVKTLLRLCSVMECCYVAFMLDNDSKSHSRDKTHPGMKSLILTGPYTHAKTSVSTSVFIQ